MVASRRVPHLDQFSTPVRAQMAHTKPYDLRVGNRSARHGAAEANFVRLCVQHPSTTSAAEIRSAAEAVQTWDVVADLATRHFVVEHVRRTLKRNALRIDDSIERVLRERALAALALAMRLDAELSRLLVVLRAHDVPAIVLKGPALARTIYEDPRLRPYGDIDLLVQDTDEDIAARCMLDHGLVEHSFDAGEWWTTHGQHVHAGAAFHRIFATRDGRAVIELHKDPLQLGIKTTCEADRWRRATLAPGLDGALMLGPEDQVVQLSAHVHKHGFERLVWLKDLDLLLRAYSDQLDWDLVRNVADREGVRASVWWALRVTVELLDTPIDARVFSLLRPSWGTRALYARAWRIQEIAQLEARMHRRAVQFDPAESWRGMLPGLVLMGRQRDRARALGQAVLASTLHHSTA